VWERGGPFGIRWSCEYSNFDVKKREWKGFLESGEKKIQPRSNTDCAQKLQIAGRSKDAAAYIMDKEVVRRDQFDPAED
jgi:hypothetical protein